MEQVPTVTPRELAGRLAGPVDQRPLLIDVREPAEHALVALPDSKLWPLSDLARYRAEAESYAGRELVVYCHLGVRSLHAAALLRTVGVNASSLEGGIDAWATEVDPTLARY